MKSKDKFVKVFTILLLGFVVINFSFIGVEIIRNPRNANFIPKCSDLPDHHSYWLVECISSKDQSSEFISVILNSIFIALFFAVFLFFVSRKIKTKKGFKY